MKSIFGVASTGDGFSLDSVVVQCAVKITFWQQVSMYLLAPFVIGALPPFIVMTVYKTRERLGKVQIIVCYSCQ